MGTAIETLLLHVGEEGNDRIEVGRRERIELVIVAAGAADRQTQHRRAGGCDHVVELVVDGHPLAAEDQRPAGLRPGLTRETCPVASVPNQKNAVKR